VFDKDSLISQLTCKHNGMCSSKTAVLFYTRWSILNLYFSFKACYLNVDRPGVFPLLLNYGTDKVDPVSTPYSFLTFIGPYIVMLSYSRTNKMHLLLELFVIAKYVECFTRINNLRSRWICWFYYRNTLYSLHAAWPAILTTANCLNHLSDSCY
jgi:hypothetical protein